MDKQHRRHAKRSAKRIAKRLTALGIKHTKADARAVAGLEIWYFLGDGSPASL